MNSKALLLLISIVFLLTPFKILAQKCEELECDLIYDKCKVETELEVDYKECVRVHKELFAGICDKKSKDYSECMKRGQKNAEELCSEKLKENLRICDDIYKTCKEMEKKQCKKPTADKFPKTLNVTISRTCYWETNGSNIPTTNSDSYNIQGVVELKERRGAFIRYESKNLNVTYQFKSIGIMKNPSDKCYGKIVHKITGEGNTSADFILDIYIGEAAKFIEDVRKGKILTQKDLKQSDTKGVYDFIGNFAGSLLLESADESTGCTLTPRGQSPLPEVFVGVNQPLFSTEMVGMLKSSEVSNCEGKGYFKWSFSRGLGPLVQIFKKYGIPVKLINYTQD